jgi:hypothetical protein
MFLIVEGNDAMVLVFVVFGKGYRYCREVTSFPSRTFHTDKMLVPSLFTAEEALLMSVERAARRVLLGSKDTLVQMNVGSVEKERTHFILAKLKM